MEANDHVSFEYRHDFGRDRLTGRIIEFRGDYAIVELDSKWKNLGILTIDVKTTDLERLSMFTVYATNEQLQRLAALSLDALVGIQFDTDARDNSHISGCFLDIDNPNSLRHFEIEPDGSWRTT